MAFLKPRSIIINFEFQKDAVNLLIRPSFRPPTKGFTDAFREFLKEWRGCSFSESEKTGMVPLEHFEARRSMLERDLANTYRATEIQVNEISPCVLDIVRKSPEKKMQEEMEKKQIEENCSKYLPGKVIKALKPYQRKAIVFAAFHKGRCIIGDEMGLGKSFESIACYRYFKGEDIHKGMAPGKLLIVCPSSLRIQWSEELCKWLPDDFTHPSKDILVVLKGSDYVKDIAEKSKVIITSYDLASKLSNQLWDINVDTAIVDECHMLKNPDSKRTKNLSPLLRTRKRIFLLSGTPALARPKELFSQIGIIDKNLFPRFHNYGVKYCNGHELPFKVRTRKNIMVNAWDYNGSSNLGELNLILREKIMIRRQKEEVLKELPPKMREKIFVNIALSKAFKKKMLKMREKITSEKNFHPKSKEPEREKSILEMYQAMSKLKTQSACKYIEEFFEANEDPSLKVLIFAHHKVMLDAIESVCTNKIKLGYMRIDGSVDSKKRAQGVTDFQNDPKCRIGILSITAAGVGLTLTKATIAIFCELHWTPGILQQAEARMHRIGQEKRVVVHYLIGKDTLEEDIWEMIEKKIDVVSTMLDYGSKHKQSGMDASEIATGQKRIKLSEVKKEKSKMDK